MRNLLNDKRDIGNGIQMTKKIENMLQGNIHFRDYRKIFFEVK
jgi:hypothetical protein